MESVPLDDGAKKAPLEEVSGLLRAWGDGSRDALDRLTPIVYAELHRLVETVDLGTVPDGPNVGLLLPNSLEYIVAYFSILRAGKVVVPINEHLNSETAMRIFQPYDIIVDGTDNFPTRYLANDAAHFLGNPLVHGSIFRFEGRLALFDSSKGTGCYRCLFPEPPPPGSVQSCAEAGVFGVLPGIIGSMMAFETIKYLLDIGRPMIGRYLLFEGEDMSFRELKLRRNKACPLCGENPTVTSLIDYEAWCGVPAMEPSEAAAS